MSPHHDSGLRCGNPIHAVTDTEECVLCSKCMKLIPYERMDEDCPMPEAC